jgi:membrane protein DedA with SNARE-associated domain
MAYSRQTPYWSGMSFFSVHHFIQLLHAYGNVVLGLVVGLESLGLPLPGETLLIAAAVLAATSHQLNIAWVILSASLGAVIGQIAGYCLGRGVGFRLLRRYGRYIGLTDRRLALGRALFRRHGVKVVFASRFIMFLRTLAALLAGANRMPLRRFMAANIAGSVVWAGLYGYGAYLLGHQAKHLAGPVAVGIGLLVAGVMAVIGLYARRHERQMLAAPPRAVRS